MELLNKFWMGHSAEDALTNLSLENIKHRFSDKFVNEGLEIFKKMRKLKKIDRKAWRESGIYELVKKTYGVKLEVNPSDPYGAGVPYTDFSITANASLRPDVPWSFSKNGERLLKKGKPIDILVDARSGYITGVEDIAHTIYFGEFFVKSFGGLTVEECFAIFLHELGHIWTYYLLLPHLHITLFLTADFAEGLVGVDTATARAVVVDEVSKELGIEIMERERLLNTKDNNEAALILYASQMGKLISMFGSNPYDSRNSEALADQFVVRHGLGKDLVTGFVKTGSLDDLSYTRGTIQRFIVQTVFSALSAPWLGVVAFFTLFTGDSVLRDDYDKPIKRLEVILQQARDRYKKATDPMDKKVALREVNAIEEILKDKEDWWWLIDIHQKHIVPWGRGAARRLHFAQALETLANNTLTTRGQKLRDAIK